MSPFEALYEYPPPKLTTYMPRTTTIDAMDQQLRTRELIITLLKANLEFAQQRMKLYADKKRMKPSMQWVYLRLQPYRQKSVLVCHNLKLSPRFYGPSRVVQRLGKVAYRLDLQADARIHPVFHVSYLKRKLGTQISALPSLPPVNTQGEIQPEPKVILDRHVMKLGHRAITELLAVYVSLLYWGELLFCIGIRDGWKEGRMIVEPCVN
ncbi:hypothetical protein F2P56_016019 [Juglans regia]|uniref:Uncharacterized protein LOC108989450 n=2 Tax=Juglans regia TaxID=51240 RepID=A0A2I4EGS7_JUGRE|nr:uncharacterized protein LOC108989450 [Juglans regia]KAF5466061.1 hypothetical protein F2P56_016019 [Juglans regia]